MTGSSPSWQANGQNKWHTYSGVAALKCFRSRVNHVEVLFGKAYLYLPGGAEVLCKAPFMTMIPKEDNVVISGLGVSNFDFDSRLVKSNMSTSSAVRLCKGKFSMGPNFVSLAKLYCDMSTKQL